METSPPQQPPRNIRNNDPRKRYYWGDPDKQRERARRYYYESRGREVPENRVYNKRPPAHLLLPQPGKPVVKSIGTQTEMPETKSVGTVNQPYRVYKSNAIVSVGATVPKPKPDFAFRDSGTLPRACAHALVNKKEQVSFTVKF